MTSLSPETILAHEIVGLRARVVSAENVDAVGIEGTVVCETTNTIRVESTNGSRVRTVPKAGATFEFELPESQFVVVDGQRLVARPARRTQKARGGSQWQSA